ncbi:MAG: AtpZ/AtpI family protein [Patescibacteria group bacterium]
MDTPTLEKKKTMEKRESLWGALGLAWELGYLIAVPIVIFGLIGRSIDRRFATSPWFLLAGIFVALVVTAFAVYRKTLGILKDEKPL